MVLFVVACGRAEVVGGVQVRGSTTLLPYVSEVAGAVAAEHPAVHFDVSMTGSVDGIVRLCDGLTPIAGSSRVMTEAERAACRDGHVRTVVLPLARDAVTVIARADEPGVACLTLAELYALAGPESYGITDWRSAAPLAAVDPSALPDRPLAVVTPGLLSGTRDVFEARALGPVAAARDTDPLIRSDAISVASEQLIKNEMLARPGSLGIVGYATASTWGAGLRLLAVDAGGGCVAPTPRTIRNGTYPLARPLLAYVNIDLVEHDGALRTFIDELVSPRSLVSVERVGSVTLDRQGRAEVARAWRAARRGEAATPVEVVP
jgi:phosphate transport system substrate-binding protein